MTTPDPPSALHEEDPDAVEDARRRFEHHSILSGLTESLSFSARGKQKAKSPPTSTSKKRARKARSFMSAPIKRKPAATEDAALDPTFGTIQIHRHGTFIIEGDEREYMWAVLYENQRGVTVFSTPYYSSSSLLPWDPDALTAPEYPALTTAHPDSACGEQASFDSLHDYPLPSGSWHWVSKSWMIDMRSTSPSSVQSPVQYDGFEYNWFFRKHGWRADVGKLSSGGYVRRRRWVRLMMREGASEILGDDLESCQAFIQDLDANSTSVLTQDTNRNSAALSDYGLEWDGGPLDIQRCRAAMMRAGRDGKMLEMWGYWLGLPVVKDDKSKRRKFWTEDEEPIRADEPSSTFEATVTLIGPSSEHIRKLFAEHSLELLEFFTYPESRARLLDMLFQAGVLTKLNNGLGPEIDFWSYTSERQTTRESAGSAGDDQTS